MFDQDQIFVRKSDAARRLGVTVRTIERWERDGLFPRRVRLGPLVVAYRADELQKFAESRQYADPRKSAATPAAA
jgi:predicted DNA-binding transcriptional regulator AlpA